ncbi:MAG: MFS transporter [Clostridia bacterium]|nr:MFS transporter [Clostridia bacterium]
MKKEKSGIKWWFVVLNLVPFIMVLGNSMLIPLLPTMKAAMNLTLMQVGLIITAFSIPAGVVIPLAGYASDHLGRKAIMAPALIIYGLGGLISGASALLLSSPYNFLLLGRVVQGVGAGGTYQLAMALTGDIFQSKERTNALGILEASNGLGKVVSPIAGSALGLIIWFAPFFAYGLLAIPIAFAVWFMVKEPEQEGSKSNTQYWKQLKNIFKEKGLPLAASFLAGMIVLFMLFGILSWFSDFLETQYGIKGFSVGLLIAIPVGTMAITSYLSGSYFQKQKADFLKWGVIVGLVAVILSTIIISFVNNLYILLFSLILLGFGTGVVLPAVNTLTTSAAASEERGLVTCLYGSVRFFGVAIGPPAFGMITSVGKMPLFMSAAALGIAIAIFAFFFIRTEKMLPPQLLQEG